MRTNRTLGLLTGLALALAALLFWPVMTTTRADEGGLRPVDAFDHIKKKKERSAALFTEAGKVLTHPRCVNCHPAGDEPLQRAGEPHEPPVPRGRTGFGVVGMRCETCHLEENYDPGTVPGAPHWHLAPRKMAWEGFTVGEICEQIKDPERNGGRDLDAIVQHMKEDALVAWGWNPGADREPAPGDHATFGELIAAWAELGAVCPEE
jgi:hypothetical protein